MHVIRSGEENQCEMPGIFHSIGWVPADAVVRCLVRAGARKWRRTLGEAVDL
jgi:hypothetical protein